MTLSALHKFFLPPVIASAAVFSAMTAPLALLGSEQIVIKLQEEPVFHGKLRDVATPYVVLVTTLSLGAGISVAAFCGWRNSSKKSTQIEQQLSSLEQHLQQKEELLKELKLSETRLQVSGLTSFLDEEVPFEQAVSQKTFAATVSQPIVAQTRAQVYQQPVNPVPGIAAKQNTERNTTATAASAFASAQTFLGYVQTNTNTSKQTTQVTQENKTTVTIADFEELQIQLREMMLQMQRMQNNLPPLPPVTNSHPKVPDKFAICYDTPNTQQVQFL